jgi:single-strand DNA-binding protein
MNACTLLGRMTRNPEMRASASGVAFVTFTLAVNRRVKKGEPAQADFLDCVAFGKTAESISNFFEKGSQILVHGRIQLDNWTDRDGAKRRSIKIMVDQFYFVGNKADKAAAQPEFSELSEEDGEVPF